MLPAAFRHGGYSLLATSNRRNVDTSSETNPLPYCRQYGNYFASHFIMGGERFDASQPEAYLFGENSDLNFLASRPLPFPYPAPQPNEPTRPLRCLINIRKESLRFVRVKTGSGNSSEASTKKCATGSDDNCNGGPSPGSAGTTGPSSTKYNIEFIFDTECRCAITVHYFCTEEVTPNGIVYSPRFPTMSSETYHYKRGCNQLFQQSSHVFDPSKYSDAELAFNNNYTMFLADIQRCERAIDGLGLGAGGGGGGGGGGSSPNGGTSLGGFGNGIGGGGCDSGNAGEVFPVVIHCVSEEGEEPRQSHVLLAVVERASSAIMGSAGDSSGGGCISQTVGSSYTLKPLKQKLFVDGLVYLLQEIYGIENKNNICNNSSIHNGCSHNNGCPNSANHNDDGGSVDGGGGLCGDSDSEEEAGGECVICMSEPRDTLILPCRHLCLCAACADSLRYQANNCPICRAPFRALLQIRAVRKMLLSSHPSAHLNNEHQLHQVGQDVPAGYESIPLLEALNGPMGGNQAMLSSQTGQTGKHVRLHANSSSANSTHSPRSEANQQGGGGTKRSGGGSGSGSTGGGGKMGKMHRNKSSSAGSLRHQQQQQQLQAHSPPRSSEQVALEGGAAATAAATGANGANSTGQLEGSAPMAGVGEGQPLARAETAPPPGRHRRHKDKSLGQQSQQQGRGLGKNIRPHMAHVSATSLAMDSSSAESKSLLDGEDDAKAVEDGAMGGGALDRGDLGPHSALPSTGSPSPAAATVITVDQATDTSLDNRDLHGSREDARDMDMLFHRRKAFPDSGSNGRTGSEDEPAELELVEQGETARVVVASSLDDSNDAGDLPALPPGTPGSGSARSSAESFSSAGSATRLLVNATTGSSLTNTGVGGHPAVTVVTIK